MGGLPLGRSGLSACLPLGGGTPLLGELPERPARAARGDRRATAPAAVSRWPYFGGNADCARAPLSGVALLCASALRLNAGPEVTHTTAWILSRNLALSVAATTVFAGCGFHSDSTPAQAPAKTITRKAVNPADDTSR